MIQKIKVDGFKDINLIEPERTIVRYRLGKEYKIAKPRKWKRAEELFIVNRLRKKMSVNDITTKLNVHLFRIYGRDFIRTRRGIKFKIYKRMKEMKSKEV